MSQSFCISDQSILITDYNDKYNNNEKVWNIARITKTWPRDTESKHSWENDTDSSVWHEAATDLQFVKKKCSYLWNRKVKRSYTRSACTALMKERVVSENALWSFRGKRAWCLQLSPEKLRENVYIIHLHTGKEREANEAITNNSQDSLVVQRLRISDLAMLSPWSGKIPHPRGNQVCVLQVLKPACPSAQAPQRSHCSEKPVRCKGEKPWICCD